MMSHRDACIEGRSRLDEVGPASDDAIEIRQPGDVFHRCGLGRLVQRHPDARAGRFVLPTRCSSPAQAMFLTVSRANE